MNTHNNGLDGLRAFLLENQVALNKLLRQDTKNWDEILERAHNQAVGSQKLVDLAADEAHHADMAEAMHEATPASAHIIYLDMAQLNEATQERSPVADILSRFPN